ncbi:vacuolar iron transporter homolog 4-like protein [Tanacetum coccineum]
MVKMVPYEAFACPCGARDVVLRESYKPKTHGKLYYACLRSKDLHRLQLCKHLLDKITVLEAIVDMYMHPEQHTVNSAVLFHEVYYNMGKLDLESENVFDGVQLLIILKFESNKVPEDFRENGPWMIHNSSIILKKWTMNTSLFKEELTRIMLWVKLHDVPLQVFSDDGISLIASQIVDKVLKDNITMGIPLPECTSFIKETVRVKYE